MASRNILLHFCVSESFLGKVLDLNTNLILLGKWLRKLLIQRALFTCFLSFVCPIAGLQHSTVKLQIIGTAPFLNPSQQRLFEAVFGKEFCT